MNKTFFVWVYLLSLLLVVSCASTPEYPYGKDEIYLSIQSDSQLNLYRDNPHTLVLCVYQLRNPNAFNQLIEEQDGLSKLLECSRFDPGVASSKRLVIHPDDAFVEVLDRSEGTKYVGFVAGYFNLHKEYVVRFAEIPLKSFGKQPKILGVDITLGPQEILDFRTDSSEREPSPSKRSKPVNVNIDLKPSDLLQLRGN